MLMFFNNFDIWGGWDLLYAEEGFDNTPEEPESIWCIKNIYIAFKFQGKPSDAKEANIGTVFKVEPTGPLRTFYYHYGMVLNVEENGFYYFHLKKKFFRKYGEIVFIKFENCTNFKFFQDIPLTDSEQKEMLCRLKKILLQRQIPYGLDTKGSHNCETLVIYLKKGKLIKSTEVINFINKFGYLGTFLVFLFDKIMIVTNAIGYIQCYFFFKKWLILYIIFGNGVYLIYKMCLNKKYILKFIKRI